MIFARVNEEINRAEDEKEDTCSARYMLGITNPMELKLKVTE